MTLIDSRRQKGSLVAFTVNDKTKSRNPRAVNFTRRLYTPYGTRRAGSLSACGVRSKPRRKKPTLRARRWATIKLAVAAASLMLSMQSRSALAQNACIQHNLVSDLAGVSDHTDTNLLNPWGNSFSPTSPFWTNGAVYKGLAISSNSVGTFIYATDFHNGGAGFA